MFDRRSSYSPKLAFKMIDNVIQSLVKQEWLRIVSRLLKGFEFFFKKCIVTFIGALVSLKKDTVHTVTFNI